MFYCQWSGINPRFINRTIMIAIAGSVISCGGGSDSPAVLIGELIDSAVEGVSYVTDSQSGITDSDGRFNYLSGEAIRFSIGELVFPAVVAGPQITPRELAAGSANPDATTTNIARLLQSLDANGDPTDGISILATAHANATAIELDQSVLDFEADVAVINLVANSGSTTSSLISADDALEHLDQTLVDMQGGGDVTLSGLAGFYDSTVNSIRQHYLLINSDGSATDYSLQEQGCYDTESLQFTALGGDLFQRENLSTGTIEQVRLARQNGSLAFNSDDPDNRVILPEVTELGSSDLVICNGSTAEVVVASRP